MVTTASVLQENDVLAVLAAVLKRSLIFQLFVIAAEIKPALISCSGLYRTCMTKFQKPEILDGTTELKAVSAPD